jgi:hypothetical protein
VPGAVIVLLMVTSVHDCEEIVPHEFCAVTQILPALLPEVTLMEAVPCPLLMVQPVGTVQLYCTAPGTVDML